MGEGGDRLHSIFFGGGGLCRWVDIYIYKYMYTHIHIYIYIECRDSCEEPPYLRAASTLPLNIMRSTDL